MSLFVYNSDLGLGGIQKKIVLLSSLVELDLFLEESTSFSMTSKLPGSTKVYYRKRLIFNRFNNLITLLNLAYYIFLLQPKVALTFSIKSLNYFKLLRPLLSFFKTKLVFSQDTILSYYNRKEHSSEVLSKSKVQSLYSICSKILVQTENAKIDLIDKFQIDKDKIIVLPNAVPANKDLPALKKNGVIFLGRLERQKRVDKLVAFFIHLRLKGYTNSFTVIGDGSRKKLIDISANFIRNIQLHNVSLNPETHLMNHKYLVLTSDFEGQPMVVLEAMSYGVIPVVLSFPGVEEYIQNGKTGFICNSTYEMAETILALEKNDSLSRSIIKNMGDFTKENWRLYKKSIKKILE